MGFAYGEAGDLWLTRSVNGGEIDRLHITPLFQGSEAGDLPVLQRWRPDTDKDVELPSKSPDELLALVAKRPTVQVMEFADYDHDGQQSEFYLQTGAGPCRRHRAGRLPNKSAASCIRHSYLSR